MKIALLLPGGDIYRYRKGTFKKALRYAPLTLTTLAALVPPEIEAEIEIYDEGVEEIPEDIDADSVGIRIITGTSIRAYRIADRLREKGITVVLGGVHPTLMPHEAPQHADAVVVGFGELTWPQVLRDFVTGKLKKIYVARASTEIKHVPVPRRDLLKKEKYATINTVQVTRGCPHHCKFCVVPVAWGRRTYYRPVREVIEEIEKLEGKEVVFLDPNPIGDREYAKKFFRELIPLKKLWLGLATTEVTDDPEVFSLMVKSGCRGLLIGFESVSQLSLNEACKEFSVVGRYGEIMKKLHDQGIGVMGTFVLGFDTDTPDVFERTLEFVNRIHIDLPRYSVYTPFPGTPAYKELEREGRILTRDWSLYDGQHVVFRPKNMSPEKLQEGLLWLWKHSYGVPSIWKRLSGSRTLLSLSLPLNIAYRIYATKLPKYVR